MKSRPAGVDGGDVVGAVAEGWGITAASVEPATVGFGSYHWVATDEHQQRLFVTVDDLDTKAWLGDTRELAFAGLGRAFDIAIALRDLVRLDVVLAPLPSVDGESVRRVSARRLGFAGRPGLEAAVQHLDLARSAGPFAEPARAWLASHAGELRHLLDDFDQVARAAAATQTSPLLTHGEPASRKHHAQSGKPAAHRLGHRGARSTGARSVAGSHRLGC